MSNPSKRKGSKWEVDLRDYDVEQGIDTTRLPTSGNIDMGDLVKRMRGKFYVVEAKAVKALSLPQWLAEAETEADNYARVHKVDRSLVVPLVVAKRRMAPIGKSYVIQELDTWNADHR